MNFSDRWCLGSTRRRLGEGGRPTSRPCAMTFRTDGLGRAIVPLPRMRGNLRTQVCFFPEGPDDGSQAWNAWKVPSRSPSCRVRYDRLARGGDCLGWWQSVAPQITPFPTGRIMFALYQAFHAWLPSFRPSGTKVSFLMLTQSHGHGTTAACLVRSDAITGMKVSTLL
jgi:hypothetical protein